MHYNVKKRREIINKRVLIADFMARMRDMKRDDARAFLVDELGAAMEKGRLEIRRRAEEEELNGRKLIQSYSYLMDQVLAIAWEVITEIAHPLANPTKSEKLAMVAIGGYGRGELAPYSDVDLLFLTPYKRPPWAEQVIETLLYLLWDLGLKVGHSSRTITEMLRLAKEDITIRTAFLESRFLQGAQPVYFETKARFEKEIVAKTASEYLEQKLAERDVRHKKMGDSRYVVEPNLKEGKGGLRDLHTLFWIAKYVYQVDDVGLLVEQEVLTAAELRQFRSAESFLWTVRCHLHYLAGRAEERLTFDIQPELAARLGYVDRAGQRGVERFMRHYFITAKRVGDLTRIFCAHLQESHQRRPLLSMPKIKRRPKDLKGFVLDAGRITIPDESFFEEDPVRMLEIFALADKNGLDLHPDAMRQLRQDRKFITGKIRRDDRANGFFMDVLTSKNAPETYLRMMNEAGIFGRFIPDFGRVVAQMQYDMYHHYTVDEHSIRAIGLLSRIEKGLLADEHPLSTEILPKLNSRRTLYVAVLLHDIAKGRGGDHSVLGEAVARKLCPRLGLSAAETDMVAWLVRWHLLMSATAFKRDLSDFKTILDFTDQVQSPERLRLLLVLTVVDIRAVGPKVWNGWKGQLLRDLFEAAQEVLVAGHVEKGREKRVAARKQALREKLRDWATPTFEEYAARFRDPYWLAEGEDVHERNARLIENVPSGEDALAIDFHVDHFQSVTHMALYAPDHPGLTYRVAGAISLVGGSIADAKIHTSSDGMAMDNFMIQDEAGRALDDPHRLERLKERIFEVLQGKVKLKDVLRQKAVKQPRANIFHVEPVVLVDNRASNRFTVIEVNASDRPALVYRLTRTLFYSKITIASAHIATFGERAVDVFYVTDLLGQKITNGNRIKALKRRLHEAIREGDSLAEKAA
ncbi:MAG: [protein-PII] uridylyltransferase [Sphingomonadales bacterium]